METITNESASAISPEHTNVSGQFSEKPKGFKSCDNPLFVGLNQKQVFQKSYICGSTQIGSSEGDATSTAGKLAQMDLSNDLSSDSMSKSSKNESGEQSNPVTWSSMNSPFERNDLDMTEFKIGDFSIEKEEKILHDQSLDAKVKQAVSVKKADILQ